MSPRDPTSGGPASRGALLAAFAVSALVHAGAAALLASAGMRASAPRPARDLARGDGGVELVLAAAPQEAPWDALSEAPGDAPREAREEEPRGTSGQTPVETTMETQAEPSGPPEPPAPAEVEAADDATKPLESVAALEAADDAAEVEPADAGSSPPVPEPAGARALEAVGLAEAIEAPAPGETPAAADTPEPAPSNDAPRAASSAPTPPPETTVAAASRPAAPAPGSLTATAADGSPAPEYPLRCRRIGHDGTALLRLRLDAGGRAVEAEVETTSGCRDLDASALRWALEARFVVPPALAPAETVLYGVEFRLK